MAKAIEAVLDSSAILALFLGEMGWDRVASVLAKSVISSVNAAEVYTKLSEKGVSAAGHAKCHAMMKDRIAPFDADLAYRMGALRAPTRSKGLSLGDRACLALAQRLGVRAMTTDRIWTELEIKVAIELIR